MRVLWDSRLGSVHEPNESRMGWRPSQRAGWRTTYSGPHIVAPTGRVENRHVGTGNMRTPAITDSDPLLACLIVRGEAAVGRDDARGRARAVRSIRATLKRRTSSTEGDATLSSGANTES